MSQRVDIVAGRGERRDSLDQRVAEWIMSAGYVPAPVPNRLNGTPEQRTGKEPPCLVAWLQVLRPGGVILSGGNNIGDYPERDQTERELLDWARMYEVPVLGICRGMQMLGVWSGGSLKPVTGHVRTRHVLTGELAGAVNSFHDFGLVDCPPDFSVLARAEDGEIEAIRHKSLPWEAWMWHPEREREFHERDTSRLQALFGH